jgi:threonyl-tRNA synthetase
VKEGRDWRSGDAQMTLPSLVRDLALLAPPLRVAKSPFGGSNHTSRKEARMSQQVQEKYEESQLYRIRHSAAHIMAQAVVEMFPEAKYTIGPPVENGFYYDFDLPRNLTPEDLEQIEKRMRQIVQASMSLRRLFAGVRMPDQPYKSS